MHAGVLFCCEATSVSLLAIFANMFPSCDFVLPLSLSSGSQPAVAVHCGDARVALAVSSHACTHEHK